MKKILIILFAVFVSAASVSAQKVIVGVEHFGGGGYYHRYYRPYYNPYYSLGFGLGYGYGNPYYGRPYYQRETRLDRQIIDIKNGYADRISSARADNSLSGRERRQEVRKLRHERDETVDNARRSYYKQPYRSYNNNNNHQNNSNNNNDSQP